MSESHIEVVDFREFMSNPLDQYVVQKVLLPPGHYLAEGTLAEHGQGSPQRHQDGSPKMGPNGQQLPGNHFWAFYYQLTEPGPDIDQAGRDLLEEANLRDYEFPRRPNPGRNPQGPSVFWITPASLRAGFFRNFVFSCGFDTSSRPIDEFIAEYRGTQLLVKMAQKRNPSNPEGRPWNEPETVCGVVNPPG